MGAVAFALLMAAELAVSVLLFGRSPSDFVAGYRTTPGVIGLAAQLAFGLLPLLRRVPRRTSKSDPALPCAGTVEPSAKSGASLKGP
jgi:hypothetical protein